MKHTTRRAALAGALAIVLTLCLPACKQSDDNAPVTRDAASADKQMQRDDATSVDLGRWADMTWEDFDRLFATFAKTDPPVVREYGICDSITCIFPSKSNTEKAEILICDLDSDYPAAEAFKLLGIETGRVITSEAGWVNLGAIDGRYSSLKYKTVDGSAERTRQLLVQFKR